MYLQSHALLSDCNREFWGLDPTWLFIMVRNFRIFWPNLDPFFTILENGTLCEMWSQMQTISAIWSTCKPSPQLRTFMKALKAGRKQRGPWKLSKLPSHSNGQVCSNIFVCLIMTESWPLREGLCHFALMKSTFFQKTWLLKSVRKCPFPKKICNIRLHSSEVEHVLLAFLSLPCPMWHQWKTFAFNRNLPTHNLSKLKAWASTPTFPNPINFIVIVLQHGTVNVESVEEIATGNNLIFNILVSQTKI